MPKEAEVSGVLLFLSEFAASSDMCALRQGEVHAEDRGLRCETSWSFYHGIGDGWSDL